MSDKHLKGGSVAVGSGVDALLRFTMISNRILTSARALGAFVGCAVAIAVPAIAIPTDPGAVDTTDRAAVRSWINNYLLQATGVPMGYTGNVDTGVVGDTSQDYRNASLLLLNIYRRLAGEQPLVTSSTYNLAAEQAAALCSANDEVQHNPPITWKFYTAAGASACSQSELAPGAGLGAIEGFIDDQGPTNVALAHRHALLTPSLTTVGVGNAPSATGDTLTAGFCAVWANDPSVFSTNLQFSAPLVLWPGAGYIPHYLIPPRWSVVLPDPATTATLNLADAAVSVTKDGVGQNVLLMPTDAGGGLVFTLDGTSEGPARSAITINGQLFGGEPDTLSDVSYHVKITNIKNRASGALFNGTGIYEYDVIGFDPDIASGPSDPNTHLINISSRSFAGAGSSTQIGGFIISGTASRKVLIRAGGPYLTQFGVTNVLTDPVLTLFAGNNPILSNDDWSSDAANITAISAQVGAVGFAAGSKDAAIVAVLNPGVPYSAQVTGKGSATGNAIVEVFDADAGTSSSLINISTRSFVGTGASIQIGGFVLKGTGPKKVLIRAGGPYLTQYNVSNVLADPVLTIFRGATQIAQNDDWGTNSSDVVAAETVVGAPAFTTGSTDAAIVLLVDANQPYTAQVSGKNGATGNALIEIFAVP